MRSSSPRRAWSRSRTDATGPSTDPRTTSDDPPGAARLAGRRLRGRLLVLAACVWLAATAVGAIINLRERQYVALVSAAIGVAGASWLLWQGRKALDAGRRPPGR